MPIVRTNIWSSARLTIERIDSETDGTVFRLSGPFTARDMYHSLSPDDFRNIFEPAREYPVQTKQVFDLSAVPYMDSHSLGMLVSHAVRCRGKGIDLRISGASPRVQELFRLTNMKSVLPFEQVQEAGASSAR